MTSDRKKPTILIVDDSPEYATILIETLCDDFSTLIATGGERALALARAEPAPDLILLDVVMSGMSGYEVCARLKDDARSARIPVIFMTALDAEQDEQRGLDLGAVDYITKPFRPALVKTRIANQLDLKRHRDHLERLVRERTRELALTREVTLEAMAHLAETRDPETGGHIRRTQNYVRLLASHLAGQPKYRRFLTDDTIDLLYKSAPLHDIGKIGIPDSILLKPGRLDLREFEVMQTHTTLGGEAIARAERRAGRAVPFLRLAKEIAYSHHEKWDGSGYPRGLAGEAIPVSARLMAVADVYDALISSRVYKAPMAHEEAVKIIVAGKGSHFDPDMVDAFLELQDSFRAIAARYADHAEQPQPSVAEA